MNSLKIKLEKTCNIIKSDGLYRGSQRILAYFPRLFKKIGSGDILFITGGIGDSAMYRCHHIAEELRHHGFKCAVTVADNPFLLRYASRFKVFIFHRVLYSEKIKKFIELAKKQKKEIIFETDDLTFDPRHVKDMEYYRNAGSEERKIFEKGMGIEILTDPYVKICTTTTSYLADKLKEYGKKVFIVPNKLSDEDLKIVGNLLKRFGLSQLKRPKEAEPLKKLEAESYKLKIGYFSGSKSHDKDFATIIEPLTKIMEKYPSAELFLFGPLDIGDRFNKFKDRVRQFSYVPREKHFTNIASIDINLAPLEINNPFCESKSELKFFEAGILKVPTVASVTRTFQEAITDGIDGFIATSETEWFNKLEKLITNENLRKTMGEKAREKALQNYTTKNSRNEEYYDYLRLLV